MKKIISLFIAALLTMTIFTACSEKPVTVADIQGTWLNVVEGSVVTSTFVYTFNSDMTYTDSSESGSDVVSFTYDETGTYSLSGNTITLTDNYGSTTFEVKFEDGNMIWITEKGKERLFTRQ